MAMNAAEILLIVVSSALTLFLAALIVALVYLIGILKQIKRITQRAENVADSVESAAQVFERSASPIALLKLVGEIIDKAYKIRKRKG